MVDPSFTRQLVLGESSSSGQKSSSNFSTEVSSLIITSEKHDTILTSYGLTGIRSVVMDFNRANMHCLLRSTAQSLSAASLSPSMVQELRPGRDRWLRSFG